MKRTYKHSSYHLARLGLASLLVLTLYAVQVDSHSGLLKHSVLSYATEMSAGGLLSGTNVARAAQGLPALRGNSLLNSSAQAKAQHMADNNYWAHVAPDGTQPWYFFQTAGYSYSRAGENLAYGFSTSQGVIDGWMNSSSHRANILGDFVDVGFGFVNTPSFQGDGNQTIVVAHYGSPLTAAAPATPPPTPAPSPAPQPAPSAPTPPASQPAASQPAPAPAPTPAPVHAPVSAPAQPTTPTTTTQPTPSPSQSSTTGSQAGAVKEDPKNTTKASTDSTPVATGTVKTVTLFDLFANKNAPLTAIVASSVIALTVVGYALTHRHAFTKALATGSHFALKHPIIDATIVLAIIGIILLTTYGHLK